MKEFTSFHLAITPYELNGQLIARLPNEISKQLPSRGQIAVFVAIEGKSFLRVLEPDGNWGHWIRIDNEMRILAEVTPNCQYQITIEPTKEWPEPEIATDLKEALDNAPQKVKEKWLDITPMARWEWMRWVNATANSGTRKIRIEKTISKLNGKHRRPCCFNLAACTDPNLSKSGRLIGVMES